MEKRWDLIKNELEKKLTPVGFSTWISPLKPLKYSKSKKTLYILVPEQLIMTMLENRYIEQMVEITSEVYGENTKITLCLPEDAPKYLTKKVKSYSDESEMGEEVLVDPRQTFDTFVVGENNRFAQAAALAVSEAPGNSYNPLFIYGGAGLGKTHLMHAIGHYVKVNNPKLKVLYVSSEMFTDDFINAIRNEKMNEFKIKYRNVDVLLLDDIQFIEEKKSTREEVFHTYNTLHDNGKQLVFSSDRPPKDLLGLDERLTSRLASGLIVDIQPPSFETKVAILLNKANLDDIEITDGLQEVIELIADKIKTNIREMEGAFNKVIAFSTLTQKSINKSLACEVLKDIITEKDAQPTPESIKKNVSKFFEIKISDLESSKRARNFSYPRQIAMYLCRDMTDLSLPKIGEYFGGRDHTTVLHACDKIEKEKKINETLNGNLQELDNRIRNI
jgi:chromosomal replication initiator protein